MVHTCDPSCLADRQEDSKFKARLINLIRLTRKERKKRKGCGRNPVTEHPGQSTSTTRKNMVETLCKSAFLQDLGAQKTSCCT